MRCVILRSRRIPGRDARGTTSPPTPLPCYYPLVEHLATILPGVLHRRGLHGHAHAALATLKPGEYSRPIQTRLGYHLLKVEERQAAASLQASEVHAAVYQQIYQRKFQQAFGRWLDQLKRRAYIELPEE